MKHSWGGVRDYEMLRQVATEGFGDAKICLSTIEVVERSNRESVIVPLHDVGASLCARLLIDAALIRLHLYVVRAFARVSHDDDLHLRAAINFLRSSDLSVLARFPEDQAALRKAVELFDEAAGSRKLSDLKKLRDKRIAHLAAYNDDDAPTYNDLFSFAASVAEIWEQLAWGCKVVSLSVGSQVEAYRESADAFWSRWEAIPPPS